MRANERAIAHVRREAYREIFNVAWERYKRWRGVVDMQAERIRTTDLFQTLTRAGWRPDREYMMGWCADFERIGRQVLCENEIQYANAAKTTGEPDMRKLREPFHEGRLRTWEVYFVAMVEYRQALRAVNVPMGTFDYWVSDIKRRVGRRFAEMATLRQIKRAESGF